MTEITLRKITAADLPVLLALYGQPSFNNGRIASLGEAEAIFARMTAYPDYAIYFAEIGREVVGSLALMIIDNIAHWGTPTAMIENVVVREDRQGGGLGGAMMRLACEMAAAKGAYKVALSSNLRNQRGHAFYESLGFEKHGFSFKLELGEGSAPPFPLSRATGEGWGEGLAFFPAPQPQPSEESQQDPHPTSPASGRGEGRGASAASGRDVSSPSPLAGEGGEGEPALRATALDPLTQRPAGFPLSNSPPQGGRGQAGDILDGAAS